MFSMHRCDSFSVDMQTKLGFLPQALAVQPVTQHREAGTRMPPLNAWTCMWQNPVLALPTGAERKRVPRRERIYQEQGPVNVDKEIHDLNVSGEDRQARGLCHRQRQIYLGKT